ELKDACAHPTDNIPADYSLCRPNQCTYPSTVKSPPPPSDGSSTPQLSDVPLGNTPLSPSDSLMGLADDSFELSMLAQSTESETCRRLDSPTCSVSQPSLVEATTVPNQPPSLSDPEGAVPTLLNPPPSPRSLEHTIPQKPATPSGACPYEDNTQDGLVLSHPESLTSTNNGSPQQSPIACTSTDTCDSELVISGVSSTTPSFSAKLQSQLDNAHAVIAALRLEMYQLKTDLAAGVRKIDTLDSQVRDNEVKAANNLDMSERCFYDKLNGLQEDLTRLAVKQEIAEDSLKRLSSARDSHGNLIRDLRKRINCLVSTPPDEAAIPPAVTTCVTAPAVNIENNEQAVSPGIATPSGNTVDNTPAGASKIQVRITLPKDNSHEAPCQDEVTQTRPVGNNNRRQRDVSLPGLEWPQQQQPLRQPPHLQFHSPTSPSWQQQHMANSFQLKHQQPQAAATVLQHPVQGDVPVPFSVNPFPVLYSGQVAQRSDVDSVNSLRVHLSDYSYPKDTTYLAVRPDCSFQIHHLNETENGHRLHSLTVDSLFQHIQHGPGLNNPLNWDLTKAFLFVVDGKGTVTMVHCHPEDHEELLIIKKAMVSVFSVHVKTEQDKRDWTYGIREKDHLGELHHKYNVEKTPDGMKLVRKHASSKDAHRFHEKTLHFDHMGTLHRAEAKDRVLLKNSSPKTPKPPSLPGEIPHTVTVSGEFPEIESSATVQLKFEGKRPHIIQADVFENLTVETLETKRKEVKHTLSELQENITESFECVQRHPEKDSVNRSECINELRRLMLKLHEDDYRHFVEHAFGNSYCYDTDCEDQRLILIDVVARIGNVVSQELLLKHVLTRQPPVDEDLRRLFIHCVALEHPAEKFVRAVEEVCFGENGQHHGSTSMTRTQSRACLAVGSLVKNLAKAGRHELANELTDKLETWLDEHKKGDSHVSKRDTWLTDTEHENHHISKAVLLHALGNAALMRSRRHLLEHAQPNRGHHLWRRAALDAMRHYKCKKVGKDKNRETKSFKRVDEKYTVRQMALSVYVKHPRRREVTRPHEDSILSRNYTYPAVARVKRDMAEMILFQFKIQVPKLDWKKEIGTKDVGASFGVYFDNSIDGLFKVLSGYVDVNVHDKGWAEIHLGVIHKHWDILLVEICYRGRLSYNMNIVKDFTVGLFEDISSTFEHIANQIVEPMEQTANDLAVNYQDPETNEPKSGFESISQAVQQLPTRTENALRSTIDLSKVAESVTGLPVVSKIQQLAGRAQSLMEDVHTEASDLYLNIKDAAVVALPFAEKEIRQSLNTVLDTIGQVTKAPSQAMSFIERSKMGADHARRRRAADPFQDLGNSTDGGLDSALETLYSKADTMIQHLKNTTGSAMDLQKGLDQETAYTEILKASFEAFKEGQVPITHF
ncbi:hypothetical protein BaRGS_00038813, partial [Batillaria attramentaria]